MRFREYASLLWREWWADWSTDARLQVVIGAGGIVAVAIYQLVTANANAVIDEAVRVGLVALVGGLSTLVVYHAIRAPWMVHNAQLQSARDERAGLERERDAARALAGAPSDADVLQIGRAHV